MYSISIIVRFYKIQSLKIRIPEIIQKMDQWETLFFFNESSPVYQCTYMQQAHTKTIYQ